MRDPAVEIFKLWSEVLERRTPSYNAENGKKDVIPGLVLRWQDIKDGGENGERKSGAIGGRRGYGGREILAYLWEKFIEIGRLADKVD